MSSQDKNPNPQKDPKQNPGQPGQQTKGGQQAAQMPGQQQKGTPQQQGGQPQRDQNPRGGQR